MSYEDLVIVHNDFPGAGEHDLSENCWCVPIVVDPILEERLSDEIIASIPVS